MARFVLVHGACHGGWCWRDLRPALAARGHIVEALDLPSVSTDPATLTEATLEADARAVADALTAPTLLVGHSAAGFSISRAAQLAPTHVTALIYLCAYVPQPDTSIRDLARDAPGQPLAGQLEIDRATRAYRFTPEALDAVLYGDCPPGTATYAAPRLGWQAAAPQAETTDPPPATHPRHYVTCTQDRVIPPAQQDAMAATLPGATRHRFDTGHSPFFAAPERLAELLDRIAASLDG